MELDEGSRKVGWSKNGARWRKMEDKDYLLYN